MPPTPLNARILVSPNELFFGEDCPTAPVGTPDLVPTKVMTIFNTGGVGVNFLPGGDPGTQDLMVTGIKIVGDDNSVAFVGGTVATLNPPPVEAQFLENPGSDPSLPVPSFNGTTDCMDVLGNPVPVKSGSSCDIVVFGNHPQVPTGAHSRVLIDSNDANVSGAPLTHNIFPGGADAPLETPPVSTFVAIPALGGSSSLFDKVTADCACFLTCKGGSDHSYHVQCSTTTSCLSCCHDFGDSHCGEGGVSSLSSRSF